MFATKRLFCFYLLGLKDSSPNITMSSVYYKSMSEPPGRRSVPEDLDDEDVISVSRSMMALNRNGASGEP